MPEKIITHLSEFIRTAMLRQGVTVRALATKTGLSVGTISDIRNGKDARISYYIAICNALNIKPELIFPVEQDPLRNILLAASAKLTREQLKAILALIDAI